MHRREISTRWTFANKFVFPVLYVLATDALAAVLYIDGMWPEAQAELRGALPNRWVEIGAWLLWVGVLVHAVRIGWLAKRVRSDGTTLFISDYRQEVQVPIAAIIDARHNVWAGSGLVWVKFEEETPSELLPWGQWIAFFPTARLTVGWDQYRPHPIVAELLEQARQERQARGLGRIQAMASGLGRRGGFGYTQRS